jgi:hypothetical protein
MMLLASNYDQSRYFKAEDVATEKKLRIKNVSEELIGMGAEKEPKLVVWFTNDKHGLILNRINNRTMRGAFGDAVDGWTNKIIVLFPTQADLRGRMVPALRVRIPPPKQPPSAAAVAPQPSGNGATAALQPAEPTSPAVDPELEPDPVKPLSEDMDDEIPF